MQEASRSRATTKKRFKIQRLARRLKRWHTIAQRWIRSRLAKRRYFIDGGGNAAQSVRKFRLEFDPRERFFIHTFEPNPVFEECYRGLTNHELHREGVWIEDGEMEFFLDREDGSGSTLMSGKSTGGLDHANPMRIDTADFSRWFSHEFRRDDYIILKLDIEGAEYDVLERMLDDGTMDYVDELFIEWHGSKVGIPYARQAAIEQRIQVPIVHWDALRY